MNLKTLSFVSALVVLLASCAAPTNISYFQDADQYGLSQQVEVNHIRLRREDKISIVVNTSNDDLTGCIIFLMYRSAWAPPIPASRPFPDT